MKKFLAFAVLTLAPAQAVSTPIKSLITGSGGQITLERDLFVVQKRTSDQKPLTMAVGIHDATSNGRIKSLGLFAFKEYLMPTELDLLKANTARVATKCFNLSAARIEAINYWLAQQNKKATRDVTTTFGPMKISFVRDLTEDGDYFTAVYMERSGTPGQVPWVNWCVR